MRKLIVASMAAGLALAAAAMPSKSELKKVQGVVNELMAGDIQAMKAGKMDAAKVAANAEQYAREADTEASKFLLLKGAFGLYVQGGAYDEALRVLDALTREVKGVPDKVLSEIVFAKLKKLSKTEGAAVFAYYERLERRMRLTEERGRIEKALKADPASKDANREMAACLVGLDDWEGALKHFALCGGKEAEAAKAETEGKSEAAADLWWDVAPDEGGECYREHAAALYRKAMDGGKLTGLKLALAKKRVAEVTPAEGAAAAAAKPAADETAATEEKPAPAAPRPVVAAARTKYDWSIPKKSKRPKKIELDLGGEKMTLLGFPGGTARRMSGESVVVTRPFWISQFPVSVAEYRCFEPEYTSENDELVKLFAGDADVVVPAMTMRKGREQFFAWLNARFGGQLPKGWVFREPTLGEALVTVPEKNGLFSHTSGGYDHQPKLLDAYHRKGMYKTCKTGHDLIRELGPMKGHGALSAMLADCRRRRADDYVTIRSPLLDRIARTEELARRQRCADWDKDFAAVSRKIVQYAPKETDPFRYAADDAPYGVWSSDPVGWVNEETFPLLGGIQVAVGYDYVGEWRKKNGK